MGGIGVISAQDDAAAAAASTSFKLNRKSAVASKLKSSISKHLRHSYSHDHVLAEYITVLVCNGKNQEQARHDLEAFLGQRTQEFVSWLWDLLLKYVHQSNKDICLLSDAKNVNITTPCAKDSKINKLKDFQSHGHDSSTMDVFVIKDDQMRQLPTTSDPNFCNVNHGQLTEENKFKVLLLYHLRSIQKKYCHSLARLSVTERLVLLRMFFIIPWQMNL